MHKILHVLRLAMGAMRTFVLKLDVVQKHGRIILVTQRLVLQHRGIFFSHHSHKVLDHGLCPIQHLGPDFETNDDNFHSVIAPEKVEPFFSYSYCSHRQEARKLDRPLLLSDFIDVIQHKAAQQTRIKRKIWFLVH